MVLTKLMGYEDDEVERREREIKDIINRIIEKNDLAEIQKFADYRNYMSYEIIINNEEVKDGKLSKQVGYNSGAGTQIPYTLILSAALSMLYNVRVNSVRLISSRTRTFRLSSVHRQTNWNRSEANVV